MVTGRKFGIRGKLAAALLVIALAPLAILTLHNGRRAERAIRAANADHLQRELETTLAFLAGYGEQLDRELTAMAALVSESGVLDDGAITDVERDATEARFLLFARVRPDYAQVRLIDSNGFERVRIHRTGDVIETVATTGLQDKSRRYYVREALAAPPQHTYFSAVDLNVEQSVIETPHRLVFRAARHVRDASGTSRGIVVVNLHARTLLDRVAALRPDTGGEVLLIDGQGRFVTEHCTPGDCAFQFGDAEALRARLGDATAERLLAGGTEVMAPTGADFISYSATQVGGLPWRVAVTYPRARVLGAISDMRREAYWVAAAVGVVVLILAFLLAATVTRPIHRIHRFIRGVAGGRFSGELVVHTRDEIEELADAVKQTATSLEQAERKLMQWNETLEREVERKTREVRDLDETKHAMQRNLQQADRLASLGMMSASLAHEVGNPLTGISAAAQIRLKDSAITDKSRRTLERILSEVDRLSETLGRITGFVKPLRATPQRTTLRDIYDRIAFLVEHDTERREIELTLEGDAIDRPFTVQQQKLEQILLNLVMNSIQAMEGSGRVSVRGEATADGIEIRVSDTGPGIPEAIRDRVFEPFFTTREDGTGLGLAIVARTVKEIHGDVSLAAAAEGGTCIAIKLPNREERA